MSLVDYSINIKNNYSVIWGEYAREGTFISDLPKQNKATHLSDKTMLRIKEAVSLLIACSIRKKVYSRKENKAYSYKVGFCTLTLPEKQKHSDSEIHFQIFKPFIRILKEKYDLGEYVWKAETQDNGNIHYHLTLNVFIHHQDINREWNKQLTKMGYTFKTPNHERATTQIKATKSIKNLGAYLCKYLSKNDLWRKKTPPVIIKEDEEIEKGKPPTNIYLFENLKWRKRIIDIKFWDCSDNLKNKKLTLKFINRDHKETFNELIEITTHEIQQEFYSIWFYNEIALKKNEKLNKIYSDFINTIRLEGKQQENYTIDSFYITPASAPPFG